MTMEHHEEFESLLGAYVLNAVDPLERRRMDKHVASCASCTREIALLRGPAAELAAIEAAAPDADDLVERIAASLPWRPRRVFARATAAVAAVALVAAGFLGFSLSRNQSERDRLVDIIAASDRTVKLRATPGFDGHGQIFVADKHVAFVLENMPEPGSGKSYQLWAVLGSKPTSMAVFGGGRRVVDALEWDGRADVFAITIEPSDGSPVPTTDPVLSGT